MLTENQATTKSKANSAVRRYTAPVWHSGGVPEIPTENLDTHSVRRRVIFWTRLAISAVLIGFLVTRIPRGQDNELWPGWNGHTAVWLGGALCLIIVSVVLSAVRWHETVLALGLQSRMRALVSTYFAGNFVGNVLPSTIGGDVLRVRRLGRATGDQAGSFASVVLERLTGWVALPVLSLIGLSVNPGLRSLGAPTRLAVGVAVGTLGLLFVVLFLAANSRVGGRLTERDDWRRFLGAIHLGIVEFRRRPVAAARVMAAAFLYQFVLVVAAHMIANAIDFDFGFTAILAFVPIVTIVQVLPITIAGFGVREGMFVYFFHTGLGQPTQRALSLGLLLYGLTLVSSLFGAPAFLVHRSDSSPGSDAGLTTHLE